jgi:FKBP-type peptidyl-prolyl cis-trans isomerase FkpA
MSDFNRTLSEMRGALLSGSDLCYEGRMKTWKRVLIGAMVLGSAVGCRRLMGGSPTAKTEDEKTLYTLGMLLGRNLGTFNLTADELELVKAGLSDMVLKRPHQVDLEKYGPKVDALARTRAQAHVAVEKALAKTFLENAARESGAVQTPSGLVFRTTAPGTGASPTPTDRVTVHYEGKLVDGTVFDSSRKRGEPATFPLNGVIKCWTEGVGRMKVGEKAMLTCPSDIAYGDGGRPPTIPGGATLIFDVELIKIEAAPPPPPPGAPNPGMSMGQSPHGQPMQLGPPHGKPMQLHVTPGGQPQQLQLKPPK